MTGQALRAVSLFSNCGAGDLGYRRAGFRFDVMAELDPRRLEVALLNHPGADGIPGDLRDTWPQAVQAWRQARGDERPALLAACPPCQGMSSARSGRGKEADADAGSRDKRNLLVAVIAECARDLKPRAVVVENVPAFLRRQVRHPDSGEPVSAARLLADELADDYETFPLATDLARYGVPQTRKRCFLTLVRRDEPGLQWLRDRGRAPYPKPTHGPGLDAPLVTAREALAGLRELDPRDAVAAQDPDDDLHFVPVWDDRRYRMVELIPPDRGGTAWTTAVCDGCDRRDHHQDAAVCVGCGTPLPRPTTLGPDGVLRLVKGFRTSSYTRMHADLPAATVTTASGHMGSDRTLHPWQTRVLSPRECAILQTLPEGFKWGRALRAWGHTNVREMIGEAVPPLFTHQHGRAIVRVLTGKGPAGLLSAADQTARRAAAALTRAPAADSC